MRKVTLGAIQPGEVRFPRDLDCLSPGFDASADEIIEKVALPYLELSLGLLERAADAGADFITTCENICGIGNYIAGESALFDELAW
ncbi:MAG: hypothetical protein FWF44_00420, partial [Defluviitaleaceae bacterium]|nr:hypothetical protein [Defluviitaleaceae bacterium]